MKVIQTEYKGYKFRSRLEARWAVFFDACNAEWEYEPEGFDLGNGIYYLPDFLIHNVAFLHHSEYKIDLWVEVKGQLTDTDRAKIEKFSKVAFNSNITPCENPILVVSKIPEGEKFFELCDSVFDMAYANEKVEPFNLFTVDGDYYSSILGIRNKNIALASEYRDDFFCLDEEKTVRAYKMARQARFEHGEKPLINQ